MTRLPSQTRKRSLLPSLDASPPLRRKSGPIANLEQVRELYALAGAHAGVTLEWIRAHDGSRWNEYADALASAYMLE